MKVNVTFSETGDSKLPFELEQKQLIDFLCALKHYTGAGCQVEIEVGHPRARSAVIEPCSFEELSRAVEGAAVAMREGGLQMEEVLKDE